LPLTYCPDCGHKTHYTEGVENVFCKCCGREMKFKYFIEKIEGDPVTWLLNRAELKESDSSQLKVEGEINNE
jgi:predicted amidophosphoribosyltransferase